MRLQSVKIRFNTFFSFLFHYSTVLNLFISIKVSSSFIIHYQMPFHDIKFTIWLVNFHETSFFFTDHPRLFLHENLPNRFKNWNCNSTEGLEKLQEVKNW